MPDIPAQAGMVRAHTLDPIDPLALQVPTACSKAKFQTSQMPADRPSSLASYPQSYPGPPGKLHPQPSTSSTSPSTLALARVLDWSASGPSMFPSLSALPASFARIHPLLPQFSSDPDAPPSKKPP